MPFQPKGVSFEPKFLEIYFSVLPTLEPAAVETVARPEFDPDLGSALSSAT